MWGDVTLGNWRQEGVLQVEDTDKVGKFEVKINKQTNK